MSERPTIIIRITAPHFCAGIVAGTRVRDAAPILRYMRGWSIKRIRHYCVRKGWTFELLR